MAEGDKFQVEYKTDIIKVVLRNTKFKCTSCGKWKAADEFGLRALKGPGKLVVRNQAQCSKCRSKK